MGGQLWALVPVVMEACGRTGAGDGSKDAREFEQEDAGWSTKQPLDGGAIFANVAMYCGGAGPKPIARGPVSCSRRSSLEQGAA